MGKFFVACLVVTSLCSQSVFGDIGGRGQCSTTTTAAVSTRSPPNVVIALANCNKLTNTAAVQNCIASSSPPVLQVSTPALPLLFNSPIPTITPLIGPLCAPGGTATILPVNLGTGLPLTPANTLSFTIPTPTTNYLLDLELVSTSDPAANQNYLQATSANPAVVQLRAFPPVFANQVYSAVLIDKNTKAASPPQYFQVNLASCTVPITGPSSFTVCSQGPITANALTSLAKVYALLDPNACGAAAYTITSVPAAGPALTIAGNSDQPLASIMPLAGATGTVTYTLTCAKVGAFTVTPKTITVTYAPNANAATCPAAAGAVAVTNLAC